MGQNRGHAVVAALGLMDRRVALAGTLGALAVVAVTAVPVRVEPGTAAWRRLVRGAEADGRVPRGMVLLLPGLVRDAPLDFRIEGYAEEPTRVGTSVDGAPLAWFPVQRDVRIRLRIPPGRPGARVELRIGEGTAAPQIRSLTVAPPRRLPLLRVVLAFAMAAALTAFLLRRAPAIALPVGLSAAGVFALASTPPLVFLTLPAAGSALALLFVAAVLAASAGVASRLERASRRAYARAVVLLAAFVFGAWVRGAFLASAGSWDTEYWKAWTIRAADHGVTRVYGDPGSSPAGRLLAQMRGEEELWKVEYAGRPFVVDYPPLAMFLWRWSYGVVASSRTGLDPDEARNVAVKLPAVLGDVVAVAVLLWALGARGLVLAAVYWATPVSWLPSAVLGYLDGAYAPMAAAALVAAGRGRAGWAGAWMAAACLIKPTAVVVAPAAAMALRGRGPSRAVLAGLAVVAVTLLPFALAGTLGAAVVHVYRILFQGTLSGGFPNPWWIVGHALDVARAGVDLTAPVRFARLGAAPFPAGTIGVVLFAAAAAFIAWRQRNAPGQGPAVLAGAALVFAYSMLAVGVHENHAHPLFLLLFCTGLLSGRLRALAAGTATVYVLNMLLLSGIGRFYGPRYAALEPLARALAAWRMAPGFDLTLALALANTALFAVLLAGLRREMDGLKAPSPPARG
jgi:hypothetical protein